MAGDNFNKIANITANDSFQVQHNYFFEDKDPYTLTYHRLQQNDFNDKCFFIRF